MVATRRAMDQPAGRGLACAFLGDGGAQPASRFPRDRSRLRRWPPYRSWSRRLEFVGTTRGKVTWIVLKILFCYVLIGFTGTLESSYYWTLLLPVISAGTSLGVLGTQIFIVLSSGAYLSFLLFINWNRYFIELPDIARARFARHLSGRGGQPDQHAGRSAAPSSSPRPRRSPNSLPKPTATCSRPKKPCAGRTVWPRWASLRRVSPTSCAIRWAPFALRRKCSPAASPRRTKWRAKWPALSPRRWTAAIRWSRAFWISCVRCSCGWRPRTWPRCSIARWPWWSGMPPRARSLFTRITRPTFRRSLWMPN